MDSIIYGKFNADVIKAIKKSLESQEINPLYIYGPSGSGKTFLLKKMAEQHSGNAKVVASKEFKPSLINDYLNYNLFIIDDINLLTTRSPVPETLFELTTYFIENNKKIVFSASCPPSELNLSDRIISRIETGVTVSIKKLDKKSRYKVLKTIGKELSDKIIRRLTEKKIHTISQAIGAIKKAKLLGYVSEETDIEERTALTEEKENEFNQFISEIRKNVPETIKRSEREERLREEYRSKMYVWKMKGFNTDRIRKVIDGPINKLTGEFVSFTMDIQRLIDIQKRYGMLDIDKLRDTSVLTDEEIDEIEKALFNPDQVEWLMKRISELEEIKKTSEKEIGDRIIEETSKRLKRDRDVPEIKKEGIMEELKFRTENIEFRIMENY